MNNHLDSTNKKFCWKNYFPVILILLVSLGSFIIFIDDFGESWDENAGYLQAEGTINAYVKFFNGEPLKPKNFGPSTRHFHGPSYFLFGGLIDSVLRFIVNDWLIVDRWHLINFSFFLLGALFLFLIAKQLFSQWTGICIVVLFITQPLLFGHGIMNAKDSPFMVLFLGSIASGLWMVDQFIDNRFPQLKIWKLNPLPAFDFNKINFRNEISQDIHNLRKDPGIGIILLIAILLEFVIFYIFEDLLAVWIKNIVLIASQSRDGGLLQTVFSFFAPNAAISSSLEPYINKALSTFHNGRVIILSITAFCFLVWSFSEMKQLSGFLKKKFLKPILQTAQLFFQSGAILAGFILGIASSSRIIGPAAGGLISIYFFSWAKWRSLPSIIIYSFIAILTMYCSWPILWGNPVDRFSEALATMSNYEGPLAILFEGNVVNATSLPNHYLIKLISIQLTEPAVIMAIVGTFLAFREIVKKTGNWRKIIILFLWLYFPIVYFTISPPRIYDNFRQLLFIIPPIFLFCGFSLDRLFSLTSKVGLRILILVLLIFPGIFSIITLHPYQYIYYNSFVGGLSGIKDRFETDYWTTSFREVGDYLNETAPENTFVEIIGPEQILKRLLRPDLLAARDLKDTAENPIHLVVIPTRHNWDEKYYPDEPIIFSVSREGVDFMVVKQVSP